MKPKTCKQCKTKFLPVRSMQSVCTPLCASQFVKAQKVKESAKAKAQDRRETKAKLEKMKTIAQLIADAQVPFNLFIRLRDKDKGCFVCGRPFTSVPGQVQHAGHVRSRGAAGHLRYNEDNCLGECEGCNGPHGAKPHQIKAGAIARIGLARYEALENNNTSHKWTREELLEIKATYTAKARELKKLG